MTGDEDTWGLGNSVGENDLLDLVTEDLLGGGKQIGKVLLLLLPLSLLRVGLFQLETLLGNTDQLLTLELLKLGDGVLIDGVDEEKNLESLLLENLDEWRVLGSS